MIAPQVVYFHDVTRTLKVNLVKDLILINTVVTFADVKSALGPVCNLTAHRVIAQVGM